MADWSSAGLPVGLVLFGITVFGYLRRKSGHSLAQRDYPGVAEKLGLEYRASRYRAGIGLMVGEFRGYPVIVDPDDQRSVIVRFRGAPALEVSSYESQKRPLSGQRDFRPENKLVRGYFRTCRATPELEERLRGQFGLAALAPLFSHRELTSLALTPSGITARFDYGSPPYIPALIAEETLALLVALATHLEPAAEVSGQGSSEII